MGGSQTLGEIQKSLPYSNVAQNWLNMVYFIDNVYQIYQSVVAPL